MTNFPIRPAAIRSTDRHADNRVPYLAANDEMSTSITQSIDHLSQGVGPLAIWRLRGVKGREAVKLSETALTEYMAAKRRAFIYQVGLVEDHTKKLMLKDSIQKTEVVEREIASIISDAATNFEGQIADYVEAACRSEVERIQALEAALKANKISERRFEQMVVGIEASTDKVIETVENTGREILANLARRFHAALKQG